MNYDNQTWWNTPLLQAQATWFDDPSCSKWNTLIRLVLDIYVKAQIVTGR